MFSLFKRNAKPLRGYKVTTVDRARKFGIAANSLKMLKEKAADKLKLSSCRLYMAKDGTEVQDENYFEMIEPQTLFVASENETIVKTDFQLMFEAIRHVQGNVFTSADIIRNFVSENRDEFDRFLEELQSESKSYRENTEASHRTEHKEWFEGIAPNLTTKEEVMAKRSQDRIRGYFYKAKDELTKSTIYRTNSKARELIKQILDVFQYNLIGLDYFSSLFNRSCENRHESVSLDDVDAKAMEPSRKKRRELIRRDFSDSQMKQDYYVSLCNAGGEFRCHGAWNNETCKYDEHRINPYASRENAVLFQMWNLDHQIEFNRSVLPSLLSAIQRIVEDKVVCPKHKLPAKSVSIVKYFLELFTVDNLKLVHIVCHDKGVHDLKSKGRVICSKCREYKIIEKLLKKIIE